MKARQSDFRDPAHKHCANSPTELSVTEHRYSESCPLLQLQARGSDSIVQADKEE